MKERDYLWCLLNQLLNQRIIFFMVKHSNVSSGAIINMKLFQPDLYLL